MKKDETFHAFPLKIIVGYVKISEKCVGLLLIDNQ